MQEALEGYKRAANVHGWKVNLMLSSDPAAIDDVFVKIPLGVDRLAV